MMPRAPEAEALYEGYAQRGFEVLSLDGSPFLQVPQPPMKPQGYPKPCGGGGSPRCHRARNLWVRSKATQSKLISAIINNHRGISGNTAPGI
jgi:hypothetical protein